MTGGISERRLAKRQALLNKLGPCPPWWRLLRRRAWRRRHRRIMRMDVSVMAEMFETLYPETVITEMVQRDRMLTLSALASVRRSR